MLRSMLVVSLLALAGAAPAPDAAEKKEAKPPMSKGLKSCRRDIKKFCKDVEPGEGRVGSCLHAHLGKLSRACKAFAGHGGAGHELDSLRDLDKQLRP